MTSAPCWSRCWARRTCAPTATRGCGTRAARATSPCCAAAPATPRTPPTPSSRATVGPGMRGPQREEALGEQGLTLGHLPQSFEFATIGGYAATRSAGQQSTGIGRFDDLITGLTLATPS